jgi:threonine dehydrogenase-like Zn-dependent dehydrogenase
MSTFTTVRADKVYEAAGVGAALQQALGTLTPQGVLALVGLHEKEFSFNPTAMTFAENTIVGCIRPDDSGP